MIQITKDWVPSTSGKYLVLAKSSHKHGHNGRYMEANVTLYPDNKYSIDITNQTAIMISDKPLSY
jgi:hypothetical protein